MAVAAPSPVKILSDLGYEIWEIENDQDYLRALMEAVNTLSLDSLNKPGKEDPRIPILQEEVRRVRADRKAAAPSPAMKKVSIDKLMGRKAASTQKIQSQKLLPGTAEKGSSPLAMRLGNIVGALGNLGNVLAQQLSFDKRNLARDKKSNIKESKEQREEEIEEKNEKSKEEKKKTGSSKIASAIAAPFKGLFGTIKTFVGNIVAGSAVLGLMKWLKSFDKSQWDGFIKALQDKAPLILAGILALAALPLVGTLAGFTGALLGGLAILGPIIPVLLKGMVVAAGIAAAIIAGKWVWDKGKQAWKWAGERISGGEASYEMDKILDQQLRDAGMTKTGRPTQFIGRSGSKKMGELENKGRNEEQEKIFQKVEAERARINALEKERNKIIGPIEKEIATLLRQPEFYTGTSVRNRKLNEAGKAKKAELESKRQIIIQRYDSLIRSGSLAPGDSNISLPSLNGLMQNKSISPFRIDQPLNGESSVDFIDLGNIGGEEQGSTSGTEGGSTSPFFSSKSNDRVSNAFVVGAFA